MLSGLAGFLSSAEWILGTFPKSFKTIALNVTFRTVLDLSGCFFTFCEDVLFSRTMLERQWPLPADEWMTSPWGGLTQHAGAPLAPFRPTCIHGYYCPFPPSLPLWLPLVANRQRSTRVISNHMQIQQEADLQTKVFGII